MNSETLIREQSGNHSANPFEINDLAELEITEGDLGYLRDNGFVDGCVVDDEAWRLDEDGNWPEVL